MSNKSNVNWQQHDVERVWVGEAPGFREGVDPTVAVMGGVHGDELTGPEVISKLLEDMNLDAGRVYLLHGNIEAMDAPSNVPGQKKGRRYTEGGSNMNRLFEPLSAKFKEMDPELWPSEVRRAQKIIPVLQDSDALLDLHDYTHDNDPFIITAGRGFKVAQAIGAPFISSGWNEQEPGGSDDLMERLGRIALCYELGRKDKPVENLERGLGAVERFLIANSMVDGNLPPLFAEQGRPRFIHNQRAFKRRTDDYELYLPDGTKNFSRLEIGQPIARLDGKLIVAREGQVPIFPMKPEETPKDTEAFSLGREFVPEDRAA